MGVSTVATQALSALRARQEAAAGRATQAGGEPTRLLGPGVAKSFHAGSGGLSPRFGSNSGSATAKVLLPELATAPLRIEDTSTGMAVEVSLKDARKSPGEVGGDGYLLYRNAHLSGATLLHRPLPNGIEDFLSFDHKPAASSVAYTVDLKQSVSGMRLVANTLEFLDEGGAPRLRIEPPYLVGDDGARTEARLAVVGCAADRNGKAPWGRRVTAPGAQRCTIRVDWQADAVAYPAVLDPKWSTTVNMVSARQDHTATILSTGKVLVAAGRTSSATTTALATAELFDRTTNTWAATGSLTGARWSHTAVQLGTTASTTTSGKVLIAGGLNGTTSQNTAQLYSVSAGTWVAAGNLPAGRHLHTATVLPDGRVLAVGGLTGTTVLNNATIYNPATPVGGAGTWAAVSATMSAARRSHTASLLTSSNTSFNNKVLIVGGNSTATGTTTLATAQLFDIAASTWSSNITISAREGHTATKLANGNVLLTGGKSGTTVLGTTVIFTIPASGSTATFPSAGTMKTLRWSHTATLLPAALSKSGQVLVAGGSNGTAAQSTSETWDGVTTWTQGTADVLSQGYQGHTATLLANGAVLIAGGFNSAGTTRASQVYDPSLALACTSNAQCAGGFCANGVCCDTACNGGCGSCNLPGKVGTCSPVANATVCRAAVAGGCDVAEVCNGTALTCPTDAVAASTVICRAAVAGGCDTAENCTGASALCPADAVKVSGTVCRAAAAGGCDVAETCNGTAATCPSDAFLSSTTVCRPSAGLCDNAETCTGTLAACPPDTLKTNGAVCRPAIAGGCDVAETCNGTVAACPADGVRAVGTICRAAIAGGCDVAETCNGTATCPADAVSAGGTVCRAAAGVCDAQETCNGVAPTCPLDGFAPSTTQCRAAVAGGCDVPENCTGGAATCPADALASSGTVCRAAMAGGCDIAETCNGTTAACPSDVLAPATTICRAAVGTCDNAETCTGTSNACPVDNVKPVGTTCRTSAGACDVAETCGGISGACPADAFLSASTTCRAANGACDVAESCTGSSASCPTDSLKSTGTACDDANRCTVNDVCQAGVCQPGAATGCAGTTYFAPLTDLGAFGENPGASAINEAGDVVGSGWFPAPPGGPRPHAFRYSAATGVKPVFPDDTWSYGWGINGNGIVVGAIAAGGNAFWQGSAAGAPSLFTEPGASANANAINSLDEIVGWVLPNSGIPKAFLYSSALGMNANLGTLDGPQFNGGTDARAIDDLGRIVGVAGYLPVSGRNYWDQGHAFVIPRGGTIQDLNTLKASSSTFATLSAATATNGTMIVGWGFRADGQIHGYRYHEGGTTDEIGGLPARGAAYSQAFGINAQGDVVGAAWPAPEGGVQRAILYTSTGQLYDLNDFVDPNSGWVLSEARDINSINREVVGFGTHGTLGQRAFKMKLPDLSPCPVSANVCQQGTGTRDPVTGACIYSNAVDGTVCDDGNTNTSIDICRGGGCRGSNPPSPGSATFASFADLGVLRGNEGTTATAINANGDVVGYDFDSGANVTDSWRYTNAAGIQPIVFADSSVALGAAINAGGTVAGQSAASWASGAIRAFTAARGALASRILGDTQISSATGINDNGQVTGTDRTGGAFIYAGVTPPTYLPSLRGSRFFGALYQTATAIGPRGEVAGYALTDSGTRLLPSGLLYTQANGITEAFFAPTSTTIANLNDDPVIVQNPSSRWELLVSANATNGTQVVGWGVVQGRCHAFRYTPSQTIVDLGTLADPNYDGLDGCYRSGFNDFYEASAINLQGDVVGTIHHSYPVGAFFYSDATQMINLQELVDPAQKFTIVAAYGINDAREIVGYGYIQGSSKAHAYKMRMPPTDPCPPAPDLCHASGVRHWPSGTCSYAIVAGASCGDGNRCNGAEVCDVNGACQAGTPVVCSAIDECHLPGTCDAATGRCSNPKFGSVACTTRRGQIEAEGFDSADGFTATPTAVVPGRAGASIEFDSVDFGAPGDIGRIEVLLMGAQEDQHVEVHLDSPAGQLVADLLTLPTAAVNPAPQSTSLSTSVVGVHRVVLVAKSTGVGSIDWFSLSKGIPTQDVVGNFPTSYQHQNPGQGLKVPVPIIESGDEEAVVQWIESPQPVPIPPGESRIFSMDIRKPAMAVGRVRWLEGGTTVGVSIISANDTALAIGLITPVSGGGVASVKTGTLAPQIVGVKVSNNGTTEVGVTITAGAVGVQP